MTNEKLMQVHYLTKELDEWKSELKKIQQRGYQQSYMSGTVSRGKGLRSDITAGTSLQSVEIEQRILSKLEEIECARNEITTYILGIEDSLTRLVFKLRCLDLLPWKAVAFRLGGGNTEDSVKKIYHRYLRRTNCGD